MCIYANVSYVFNTPYEKISDDLIWFYLISCENHLIFWFLIWLSDFSDENIIFSYELLFFSYYLRCSSDCLSDFSFSDKFSCISIWSQMIRLLSHTTYAQISSHIHTHFRYICLCDFLIRLSVVWLVKDLHFLTR